MTLLDRLAEAAATIENCYQINAVGVRLHIEKILGQGISAPEEVLLYRNIRKFYDAMHPEAGSGTAFHLKQMGEDFQNSPPVDLMTGKMGIRELMFKAVYYIEETDDAGFAMDAIREVLNEAIPESREDFEIFHRLYSIQEKLDRKKVGNVLEELNDLKNTDYLHLYN